MGWDLCNGPVCNIRGWVLNPKGFPEGKSGHKGSSREAFPEAGGSKGGAQAGQQTSSTAGQGQQGIVPGKPSTPPCCVAQWKYTVFLFLKVILPGQHKL